MPETLSHTEAQLRFNDCTIPCPDGLTLASLLDAQSVDANKVATAVNGQFISSAMRGSTLLSPGDTVLTFQAIVGG